MGQFSITANPFAVLAVSPRDRLGAIEDACEDALVDRPDDEAHLLQIKKDLIAPKARLDAELGWLADLSPRRSEQLLKLLQNGDSSGLYAVLQDLPPLARANLAADAASRFKDGRFVPIIAFAHEELDQSALLASLNAVRAAAGFPTVSDQQVVEGLRTLKERHADAALEAYIGDAGGPERLAAELGAAGDRQTSFWLSLMRGYERWATPHVSELERDIDSALKRVLEGEQVAVTTLYDDLKAWARFGRPSQIFARAAGLDDERSYRLFNMVRSACIDLANDHKRYEEAERVSLLMRSLFEDVPTAITKLSEDIATLAGLKAESGVDHAMSALRTAINEAKGKVRRTALELQNGGFGEESYGSIATLRDAFVAAVDALTGTPRATLPHIELRSFALDLNNEDKETAAALRLLEGAARLRPPQDPAFAAQLENDIKVARDNLDFERAMTAMKEKRWNDAERSVDALLSRASAEEQSVLTALKRKIVDQRSRRFWKFAGLAGTGLFVVYLILVGSVPTTPPSTVATSGETAPAVADVPTAATDVTTAAAAAADASAAAAQAAALPSSDPPTTDQALPPDASSEAVETPPIGTDQVLGPAQLRYCKFEQARLEAVQNILRAPSDAAVEKFNARVSDYNARCGNFRALHSDVAAAEQATTAAQSRIDSEAQALASEWSQ
jgi:hypothetical protein